MVPIVSVGPCWVLCGWFSALCVPVAPSMVWYGTVRYSMYRSYGVYNMNRSYGMSSMYNMYVCTTGSTKYTQNIDSYW